MHHPQLEQCPLFQGLTPEEQAYALSYFDAKTKTYEKGEFLHHVSFPLERVHLIQQESLTESRLVPNTALRDQRLLSNFRYWTEVA